jgi:gas vesicle structural protein
MTSAIAQRRGGYLDRPSPSSLADVVEVILDKGLVIDAYVRVSLVGIELLTIDARIVIASVDTYLRFAEATNRLDLYEHGGKDLAEMTESLSEGGAKGKTRGALSGAKDKVSEFVHGSDDDDDDSQSGNGSGRRRRAPAKQAASRRSTSRRRSQDEGDDE